MTTVAVLGLIVSVLFLIIGSLRGYNIGLIAIISSIILIVTNDMDVLASLCIGQQSFLYGFLDFIAKNLLVFWLGAIFGSLLEKSGATRSIANFILEKTPSGNPFKILIGITLITAFLTYSGINTFIIIFTLVPMVRPIFKELDLNWELFYIPFYLGGCTFASSMLPGTPGIKNYIPTTILNTSLTAAPALGLIASLVTLLFGLLYMKYAVQRSVEKGEGYRSYLREGDRDLTDMDVNNLSTHFPTFIRSVLPTIVLILTIFMFNKVEHIILIALFISILLAFILFKKELSSPLQLIKQSSMNAFRSIFSISCSVAFGTVLIASPGFENIQNLILGLPLPDLTRLSILTFSLSGMMGTGVGPVSIVSQNYAHQYLAMGYSAELLHRVISIASGVFSCMPHTGMVISSNHVSGLSYRNGFKHAFIIVNASHILSLIVVLLLAPILYL